MALYGKIMDSRAISAGTDTGRAKLPSLTRVKMDDPALQRWVDAVSERLEVREGARGNDAERVVTQREFKAIAESVTRLQNPAPVGEGDAILPLGGGLTATVAIEKFAELIRKTKLYRDLLKRLDDPSRFEDFPEAVRKALLRSLTEEAGRLGAKIDRVEHISTTRYSSLAMRVDTVTAAMAEAQAGLRETLFASAEADRAQAGKITQLEVSLGNYYQDGAPGRALLEEQMSVTADRVDGLRSQYTLKVQAGGALAGFGIAAEEVDGVPRSAFIISADKFAIVAPSYAGGLTNTPSNNMIPFGVDANGIYMNTNVYVKGTMRVDTGGKTLIEGLRGSVNLDGGNGSWSDATARQAVWTHLGKAGSPPNSNHLVIGDTVRIGATTRTWNGSSWIAAGMFINGDMVVDGTLAASKINTTGLTIKDSWGNVIFGSGVPVPESYLSNAKVNITNSAGTTKVMVNGAPMLVTDFVNSLSKINSTNIGTFMDAAAIGNAYIGNAAVGTLNVSGGAVTAMSYGVTASRSVSAGTAYIGDNTMIIMPASSATGVVVTGTIQVTAPGSDTHVLTMSIVKKDSWGNVIGALASVGASVVGGKTYTHTLSGFDGAATGICYYAVALSADWGRTITVDRSSVTCTGGKR